MPVWSLRPCAVFVSNACAGFAVYASTILRFSCVAGAYAGLIDRLTSSTRPSLRSRRLVGATWLVPCHPTKPRKHAWTVPGVCLGTCYSTRADDLLLLVVLRDHLGA